MHSHTLAVYAFGASKSLQLTLRSEDNLFDSLNQWENGDFRYSESSLGVSIRVHNINTRGWEMDYSSELSLSRRHH